MTANPCPQHIWNHTDGCTCTSNGSVTAEVDVDLDVSLSAGTSTVDRRPYVGDGADGARRSASIDRSEWDVLDRDDPRRDELARSAERWDAQAERLDRESAADHTEHMDTRIAALGERYERDDKTYEVVRITPAGAAGTSHADGPKVHAKIVLDDGTLSDYTADIWTGSMSHPASAYTRMTDPED